MQFDYRFQRARDRYDHFRHRTERWTLAVAGGFLAVAGGVVAAMEEFDPSWVAAFVSPEKAAQVIAFIGIGKLALVVLLKLFRPEPPAEDA